jgi:hypothetical protein
MPLQRRTIVITTADGNHIHFSSLKMTRMPLAEKKSIPIGDTSISRHLKKYRPLSNGAKNATPKPPFVIESNIPCETVDINKKRKVTSRLRLPPEGMNIASKVVTATAKEIECVIPLWPSISPYSMPKWKPTTSKSGATEQIEATSTTDEPMLFLGSTEYKAIGTAACVNTDGMTLAFIADGI